MKSSMSCIAEGFRTNVMMRLIAMMWAVVLMSADGGLSPAKADEALYSSIIVDLAPIKATGLGDLANPIGAAVKRALNRTYAGAIDGKNKALPVLVVEVETIYYGQEEESFASSRMFPNFTRTRDQMSGHAVVRKGKAELNRVSVLGNNITQGGWPPIDDVKSGRLQALADQFAEAVRNDLGD